VSSNRPGDENAAAPSARSRPASASGPLPNPTSDDRDLPGSWIESAPHAIAVTHGPEHVLRQVNPAFCRLMGMEAEAVLGRRYAEVFPEPAGEGPLPLLERVFHSGVAEPDFAVPRRRADGAHAVWSCTVWPLGSGSGETTGLIVEVRDRTHEAESVRRLEEMADQIRLINERLLRSALQEQEWAEKAEAAARAKSDFLSMMSHELRTPLSGIVGYTDILLGEMVGPINEKQRDGLRRITSCSTHLVQIIDDVLDYARMEAHSIQVRTDRVDLCRVASEAAAIIEPLAARKGLRFLAAVPNRPLPLRTDSQKVRQILLNLLGNAVKFTDAGEVRLEVREEGAGVYLCVRDTGIGISSEDLERIFEPFVQTEAVATRRFGGTGLGLPISRSLARLLGGEVTAESRPGHGSTFMLRLPCVPPASSYPSSLEPRESM
jgi:PAS domain S-box-containing protein